MRTYCVLSPWVPVKIIGRVCPSCKPTTHSLWLTKRPDDPESLSHSKEKLLWESHWFGYRWNYMTYFKSLMTIAHSHSHNRISRPIYFLGYDRVLKTCNHALQLFWSIIIWGISLKLKNLWCPTPGLSQVDLCRRP